MPFPIPKIQYANVSTTGDTTSGLATLTNLVTTEGLEAGMFARGAGIPAGATIVSIDAVDEITISANATATASSVSFEFGYEIEFEYPPQEPNGEKLDAIENLSRSQSGRRQISVNYIEAVRSLKFSFVNQDIKELVDEFMQTWALLGEEFRYYDDKLSVNFITVELNTLKYTPVKKVPKGIEIYLWEFVIDTRRVVA